jgi:serine/threonine protein kinase/tetratricopeptide (TPR) repeat protein
VNRTATPGHAVDFPHLGLAPIVRRVCGPAFQTKSLKGERPPREARARVASDHVSIKPESILFGEYRVLEELRQGGMGAVYRAHHLSLGVDRAIKVIRADQSDDPIAAEFFLREAHALLDVQHEAVVRCHELLRDDAERFYLVMELINGPTLSELLKQRPLGPTEIHALLRRLGPGLAAAHACGVIHRDIAADNIVLPEGRPDLAKLIDFGLAKLVATGDQTIQDGFKGRLAYASPEQLGLYGGRIDQRSDIYSLGVVLAEAASGEPLFARPSFFEAFEVRRTVPELAGSIRGSLRSLIQWMLAPDPKDRPESVSVLLGSELALGRIEERTPTRELVQLRRPAPEAVAPVAMVERRTVTAMYLDLVDGKSLRSNLDDEDYHELLQEVHRACVPILERYDAEIARVTGSALVVYFGYPRAHEDDARRAVLAGLDILSMFEERRFRTTGGLELNLAACAGMHTGPVVVGGRDLTQRHTVGRTVHLAAGLQALAASGTITMSGETLALVRDTIEATDLGGQHIDGVSGEVRAHSVGTGRSSRIDAVPTPKPTPLVARDGDLRVVENVWRRVVEGRGHAVFVSGDAGVGKSRLVRAFRDRLTANPPVWLECSCSAFAINSPLYPVLGLIGQLARLDGERGELADRRNVLAELERPGSGSTDWLPLFKKILALVNQDDARAESPERLRRRTLEALADWTHDFALRQPAVLVIEDFHWSDHSTREFFSLLLRRLHRIPLLCLVTHRPEFVNPWRDSEDVTGHELGHLSQAEAESLVERMTESGTLSAAARREIARRAGGNPLFVEELVKAAAVARTSADSGGVPPIPASLESSLLARLDRLGAAKRIAQLASTLGREFPYRLLAAISDEPESRLRSHLTELVRADILSWADESPGDELCFKHALIQDAAYSSLLRRNRRDVHLRVAHMIEDVWPERIRRQPEVLAHHLFEAGETLGAANAYRAAGRRAVGEAAYEEGLGHYRHGLEAIEQCPPSIERDRIELALRILLGNALMATRGYGNPEILPVWDRAAELGQSVEDHEEWSSAVNGSAVYWMQTGNCTVAVEQATRLLEIAETRGIRIAALRGHGTLAQAVFYLGDGARSLEHAERSLASYEAGDFDLVTYGIGYDQAVIAHGAAALAHWWLGNYDRSLASAHAGLSHARTVRSSQTMAMALTFLSFSHYLRRETSAVLDTAAKVEAMAIELRFPVWHALSLVLSGAARAWHLHDPVGLEMIDRGTEMMASTNEQSGAGFALSVRAEALWGVGRIEEALATSELGIAVSSAMNQPYFMPELFRLKGELMLATGLEEGEQVLHESLADAEARGARALQVRAAGSLARRWLLQGRNAEAGELLATVMAQVPEGRGIEDVDSTLALLVRARGSAR